MVYDSFRLKTEEESKKMISEFWLDCEYLVKLRVLLKVYEKLNITKIESLGVNGLWKKLSLERQKDVYQDQHLYQI